MNNVIVYDEEFLNFLMKCIIPNGGSVKVDVDDVYANFLKKKGISVFRPGIRDRMIRLVEETTRHTLLEKGWFMRATDLSSPKLYQQIVAGHEESNRIYRMSLNQAVRQGQGARFFGPSGANRQKRRHSGGGLAVKPSKQTKSRRIAIRDRATKPDEDAAETAKTEASIASKNARDARQDRRQQKKVDFVQNASDSDMEDDASTQSRSGRRLPRSASPADSIKAEEQDDPDAEVMNGVVSVESEDEPLGRISDAGLLPKSPPPAYSVDEEMNGVGVDLEADYRREPDQRGEAPSPASSVGVYLDADEFIPNGGNLEDDNTGGNYLIDNGYVKITPSHINLNKNGNALGRVVDFLDDVLDDYQPNEAVATPTANQQADASENILDGDGLDLKASKMYHRERTETSTGVIDPILSQTGDELKKNNQDDFHYQMNINQPASRRPSPAIAFSRRADLVATDSENQHAPKLENQSENGMDGVKVERASPGSSSPAEQISLIPSKGIRKAQSENSGSENGVSQHVTNGFQVMQDEEEETVFSDTPNNQISMIPSTSSKRATKTVVDTTLTLVVHKPRKLRNRNKKADEAELLRKQEAERIAAEQERIANFPTDIEQVDKMNAENPHYSPDLSSVAYTKDLQKMVENYVQRARLIQYNPIQTYVAHEQRRITSIQSDPLLAGTLEIEPPEKMNETLVLCISQRRLKHLRKNREEPLILTAEEIEASRPKLFFEMSEEEKKDSERAKNFELRTDNTAVLISGNFTGNSNDVIEVLCLITKDVKKIYIPENFAIKHTDRNLTTLELSVVEELLEDYQTTCDCYDGSFTNCRDNENCPCSNANKTFEVSRRIKEDRYKKTRDGLYLYDTTMQTGKSVLVNDDSGWTTYGCACSSRCNCNGNCSNNATWLLDKKLYRFHIVRRNRFVGFETISLNCIPVGTFVFEFTGKPKREKEMDPAESDYAFVLTEKRTGLGDLISKILKAGSDLDAELKKVYGDVWLVDPKLIGNVGRMCAHSCEPNMRLVPVFEGGFSPAHIRYIAVSIKPIFSSDSLSFDYGPEYYEKRLRTCCQCMTPSCRRRDPNNFPSTLEEIQVDVRNEYADQLKNYRETIQRHLH